MTGDAEVLRAVADLLDAHPELQLPHINYDRKITWFTPSTTADAAAIVAAVGGDWVMSDPTDYSPDYASLTTWFAGCETRIISSRDVIRGATA